MNLAAFEINGQQVARERFYEIACDPRRSVAVEACAGAGKTWMLVSRMVRALLGGTSPQDILAITFTKKAAAEMRQRLLQWLAEFAVASDDELRAALTTRGLAGEATSEQLQRLRQLHAEVMRGGRPVQIRTFHSWFAALVRSAPLALLQELGLPSQYELLENDALAVAGVWRRFHARVALDPIARADYMAVVASYGRHQTNRALESALSKRVEFALADAHGVVERSVQQFGQQFPEFAHLEQPADFLREAHVLELLWASARLLGASSLKTCREAGSSLERALSNADTKAIYESLFTDKGEGTPRKLSDKLAGIETVRQAQALLMRVRQATEQHQAWLYQLRMLRLVRGLVQDYAALKRERGWVDMGDLERAALVLMSDPFLSGWVQERLDTRVRHLLIDEFQDTNPLQWQALNAWLSGYGGAGSAPSVFIVGDPKQSIYRFRRAEPQVFRAAKQFVVQGLGGDLLSCDHTRRNANAVVDVVNNVMQEAQAQGEFDGYRLHSTESPDVGQVFKLPRLARDARAARSRADGPMALPQWRDSLTTPRLEAEETRKAQECRQAAQWLARWLQEDGAKRKPGDVMVLARKRERLGLMQEALEALHIPSEQPEKSNLCDMPEVQDIVALLDVLVSTRHDLSLARALKSPLFGASDADLVQLVLRQRAMQAQAVQGAVVSWWQVLQDPAGLPEVLRDAGASLYRWQQWLATLPPHDALHSIYADADVLARFAAAAPATHIQGVLANLQALLHAVLSLDGGRYTTPYGLVRALRTGAIAAPVRANAAAVRLLTVHGAKGLEAPLVMVLDTDSESSKSETMGVLVNWPGEAAYPRRFVFLASESQPPACVADDLAREQAERKREELNALYVALTRTQSTLVVSSTEPHIPNSGSWWQRLEALATEASWSEDLLGEVTEPSVTAYEQAPSIVLKVLPKMDVDRMDTAQAAIKNIAIPVDVKHASSEADSLESRIGQAMHRLLQWVAPVPGGVKDSPWLPTQCARVAAEFALDTSDMQRALDMALTILRGAGAWAWDSRQLAWASNEVPITLGGRMLYMDRLVRRASTQEWWILDYKSSASPLQQPALVAQLGGYRVAVAKAYPGQPVRAAFLTAQGELLAPND